MNECRKNVEGTNPFLIPEGICDIIYNCVQMEKKYI